MNPEKADNIRYLLACGLEPLLDEIPTLIRDTRLQLGLNDIALAIFVEEDGRTLRTYGKPRVDLYDNLRGFISTEMLTLFGPTGLVSDVPIYVHYNGDQFAFVFIMPAKEAGVLN